jgi:hypothetical protein
MEELVEELAAAAHDSWMESTRANGHTSRISQATGEEQMVPYDQLSESIKDFDRNMVRGVLKNLDALGYQVARKP